MGKKYPDLSAYIEKHYIPASPEPVLFAASMQPSVAQPLDRQQPLFPSVGRLPAAPAPAPAPRKSLFGGAGIFKKFQKEEICAEKTVARESCTEDISAEESYDQMLEELKEKLDERQSHLADSFSEYLLHLIEDKGMQNVEVYKAAAVDKKLFAKIKNDPEYHPQKLTCLCLCVGARCNLDEAKDLLSRAGYAFSPSDMRDVIFQYFIEKEIYDIYEIDIQLDEYGVPGIIA